MFDFSLAELGVVGVVSIALFGPREIISLFRNIRDLKGKLIDLYNHSKDYLNNILDEEQNVVDVIVDMDGNLQKTYDLSQIKPQIKDE